MNRTMYYGDDGVLAEIKCLTDPYTKGTDNPQFWYYVDRFLVKNIYRIKKENNKNCIAGELDSFKVLKKTQNFIISMKELKIGEEYFSDDIWFNVHPSKDKMTERAVVDIKKQ